MAPVVAGGVALVAGKQVHVDRSRAQDNENRVLPVAQAEDVLRAHAEPLFCPLSAFNCEQSGYAVPTRFFRICDSSPRRLCTSVSFNVAHYESSGKSRPCVEARETSNVKLFMEVNILKADMYVCPVDPGFYRSSPSRTFLCGAH